MLPVKTGLGWGVGWATGVDSLVGVGGGVGEGLGKPIVGLGEEAGVGTCWGTHAATSNITVKLAAVRISLNIGELCLIDMDVIFDS